MGCRLHVAKVYKVAYRVESDIDEFESNIRELEEFDEWLVHDTSENCDSYEIAEEKLKALSKDPEVPQKLRDFCKALLKSAEQSTSYMKVDIY